MKRNRIMTIIALFLAVMMTVSLLAGCGKQPAADQKATETVAAEAATETAATVDEAVGEGQLVGGWSLTDSPVVTDAVKSLLNQAVVDLADASYIPVAYVATQVVAGTNHLLLCKVTPDVPDAKSVYKLVTVYEDLQGGAEITNIYAADVNADVELNLDGGWGEPATPELTDEAKAALEKAVAQLGGAKISPIALLSTQIVAGTNYRLLCEITPAVADAQSHYAVVTVYEDLEGNAEITGSVDFVLEGSEDAAAENTAADSGSADAAEGDGAVPQNGPVE